MKGGRFGERNRQAASPVVLAGRQSPIQAADARLNDEKVSGQQVTRAQNPCMCAVEPAMKPDLNCNPSTVTVKSPLPDVLATDGIAERSFGLQGERRAL